MFTGLVEAIGTVTALTTDPETGTTLTITTPPDFLSDAHLGDSISINGTCLTITTFTPTSFTVDVSPETLRRTNLSTLTPPPTSTSTSSNVNLEKALTPSTRLGGHLVQGHVDTTATITAVENDGNTLKYRFQPRDQQVMTYVVEKGCVAVDGVSLTVMSVGGGEDQGNGWFEVMLVPYTQERIVTADKSVGEMVNVEVDMTGKYVEKQVVAYLSGGGGSGGVLEEIVEKAVRKRVGHVTAVEVSAVLVVVAVGVALLAPVGWGGRWGGR